MSSMTGKAFVSYATQTRDFASHLRNGNDSITGLTCPLNGLTIMPLYDLGSTIATTETNE